MYDTGFVGSSGENRTCSTHATEKMGEPMEFWQAVTWSETDQLCGIAQIAEHVDLVRGDGRRDYASAFCLRRLGTST